jgi:hypothetical protein
LLRLVAGIAANFELLGERIEGIPGVQLLFVAKLDGATDQVGQAACRRRPHARIGQR